MPDTGSTPPAGPRVNRRGFFRGLLLQGLDQAEHAGRRMAQALPDFIGDSPTQPRQTLQPHPRPGHSNGAAEPLGPCLRPPGALPEAAFLDACTRCGDCIRACPAQCIVAEAAVSRQPSARSDPRSYPHIVPRISPCVVCEDLSCMKVCPTGALQLTEVAAIAMGKAQVNHASCLRTPASGAGEDCRLCITQCPLGDAAIRLDEDRVEVQPGCIGCGVCERACPTEPASIVIVPAHP